MVPPASHKVPRVSWYSGYSCLFHLSRTGPLPSVAEPFLTLFCSTMDNVWSPQPRKTEVFRFGLFRFRSPLLTESRLISLPEATEMFQFAPCLRLKLWIHFKLHECLVHAGFPIRKSADQSVCATPRSLSQLITSFIDDWCQGIRPALLVT